MTVKEAIPYMFGSVKTAMIKLFDEHYLVVTEVVAAATIVVVAFVSVKGRGVMHYRDFNNMTPLEFDRVKDLIAAIRWISDVESCFFT